MEVGGFNATPWLFYPQEGTQVPIVEEDEWATGLLWMGAEHIAPTGVGTPNLPTRSESL